ncbi:MAG: ribose 5-phosphate isomerase B [Rikenellaceae bacterium]|jgi:ribose 5-phosphate isomerase B|nr:ribose 5-phosphate isomerase B [Rikenellaceae bacterium]
MKKIGIAADHAGFQTKEYLVGYLASQGWEVFDFGCYSEEPCDYPDVGHPLAEAVASGEFERGISVCGSGVGISIVVNKHRGIRGALCWEPTIVELCRRHNDANILCLPGRFMDNATAEECVRLFLTTEFEGGRHQTRIDKIELKR